MEMAWRTLYAGSTFSRPVFSLATPGEFCFLTTWTARHSKVLIQLRSSLMMAATTSPRRGSCQESEALSTFHLGCVLNSGLRFRQCCAGKKKEKVRHG